MFKFRESLTNISNNNAFIINLVFLFSIQKAAVVHLHQLQLQRILLQHQQHHHLHQVQQQQSQQQHQVPVQHTPARLMKTARCIIILLVFVKLTKRN